MGTRSAEELGAGEILLTSVDREGTTLGFEVELVRQVMDTSFSIPVIVSGGMGKLIITVVFDNKCQYDLSHAHVLRIMN